MISFIESGNPQVLELAATPTQGTAHLVGVTGPPGAGKSTLVDALVATIRSSSDNAVAGSQVAVLAIDPTSPKTGGALLGDRVRMSRHELDDAVFIRSMATRGELGGLASSTPAIVKFLAGCGFATVIIETVGVGQVEIEVSNLADTVVVVANPGAGDGVQAAKAGINEIADVLVVNKADSAGASHAAAEIKRALDLSADGDWRCPVLMTVATSGEGVPELWEAICSHRHHS